MALQGYLIINASMVFVNKPSLPFHYPTVHTWAVFYTIFSLSFVTASKNIHITKNAYSAHVHISLLCAFYYREKAETLAGKRAIFVCVITPEKEKKLNPKTAEIFRKEYFSVKSTYK